MNSSFDEVQQIGAVAALLAASAWCAQAAFGASAQEAAVAGPSTDKSLSATLSKAAHFRGASVPVTIRFSASIRFCSHVDSQP
jgi:hypothetical protein